MKAAIPCPCQEQLFKNLGEYFGEEIKTEVKADSCCPHLSNGKTEVRSMPAILMYLQRYFCELTLEIEQGIYYAHALFEKLHYLMNLVENPKDCQPNLFKHGLEELLGFMKMMNEKEFADNTYLNGNKKQVQDVYMGFLLKNAYKHAVTEKMAGEMQNLTRYLKTVEKDIVFAAQEMKFTPKK